MSAPEPSLTGYQSALRVLASVFVFADFVRPSSRDIGTLIGELQDDELLPGFVQELGPGAPKSRVGLQTLEGDRQLVLLGARYDSVYLPKGEIGEESDVATFCSTAAARLTVLLDHFRLEAHRLAIVQEGFGQHLSESAWEQVRRSVLHLPPFYEERAPLEWDWRCIARVEKSSDQTTEPLNCVTSVGRVSVDAPAVSGGSSASQTTSRRRVELDSNT